MVDRIGSWTDGALALAAPLTSGSALAFVARSRGPSPDGEAPVWEPFVGGYYARPQRRPEPQRRRLPGSTGPAVDRRVGVSAEATSGLLGRLGRERRRAQAADLRGLAEGGVDYDASTTRPSSSRSRSGAARRNRGPARSPRGLAARARQPELRPQVRSAALGDPARVTDVALPRAKPQAPASHARVAAAMAEVRSGAAGHHPTRCSGATTGPTT